MNIDLAASTGFADQVGMVNFFLVHRLIHDAEASAITAKFGIPASSFAITDATAEREWLEIMKRGEKGKGVPVALQAWLKNHADIHANTYVLLGQTATAAPDLSLVDFGSQSQFYDWMFSHQQMHDYEQSQLGIS